MLQLIRVQIDRTSFLFYDRRTFADYDTRDHRYFREQTIQLIINDDNYDYSRSANQREMPEKGKTKEKEKGINVKVRYK